MVWYVSVYKARKGRIRRTNIICNELIGHWKVFKNISLAEETDRQTDLHLPNQRLSSTDRLRIVVSSCFIHYVLSSLSDGELEASEPEPEPDPDPELSDPDSDPDLDLSDPSALDSEVEGLLSSLDLPCDPEHPPTSLPKSPSESDQKQPQCGGHAAYSLGGGNK